MSKREECFIVDKQKSTMRKTIGWASVAYGAFTALSIIGPIVLDRLWSKQKR
jgi:hypothetical protein